MKHLSLILLVTWPLLGLAQDVNLAPQPVVYDSVPGTDVVIPMVKIPGGTFLMGSPHEEAGRDADEGPQVEVDIDPFWIGQFELSFEAYQAFQQRKLDGDHLLADGSSYDADAATRPSPPYEDPTFGMGTDGYPAASMTQYAALKYCQWLYQKTGIFYRLPTEAEWEYACRAGSTTAWHFGDDEASLDEYAWYYGNSNGVYHELGTKNPNAWGLYDMHGNVAEWTLDQYQEDMLAQLSAVDSVPENPWVKPTRLHPRTVRGGSYDDDPAQTRSAERLESSLRWKRRDPQIPKSFWWNTDSPFVGFRLVRPMNQPTPAEVKRFWSITLDE